MKKGVDRRQRIHRVLNGLPLRGRPEGRRRSADLTVRLAEAAQPRAVGATAAPRWQGILEAPLDPRLKVFRSTARPLSKWRIISPWIRSHATAFSKRNERNSPPLSIENTNFSRWNEEGGVRYSWEQHQTLSWRNLAVRFHWVIGREPVHAADARRGRWV
jgi:hypothetical protein